MHKRELLKFAKVLNYILGVRPDEFGLVPDSEGYVSVKTLLQAFKEEPGWTHIGRGHLTEVMHSEDGPEFEMEEDRIRSLEPEIDFYPEHAEAVPDRLYHGVRQKAHIAVRTHGLKPSTGPWVVLWTDPEMALRVAKRKGPNPVLLEVKSADAARKGIRFMRLMETVVLADDIPAEYLIGPPLPPEEERKSVKPPPKPKEEETEPTPGSFILDPEMIIPNKKASKKKAWDVTQQKGKKGRNKEKYDRKKRDPW